MKNYNLDTNCLIGYPRSGNSLLRVLIEFITERVVEDYAKGAIEILQLNKELGKTPKNPPIMRSYHLQELHEEKLINGKKINLILRNYRDAIQSHKSRGYVTTIKDYYSLIKFYDSYENKGSLIYYEDLIDLNLQEKVLQDIFSQNNIVEIPNWNIYLKNKEKINECCQQNYYNRHKKVNVSQDNTIKREIERDIFSELKSDIIEKYLNRYKS